MARWGVKAGKTYGAPIPGATGRTYTNVYHRECGAIPGRPLHGRSIECHRHGRQRCSRSHRAEPARAQPDRQPLHSPARRPGIALTEIYDATSSATFTAATPRLINVSARTQVGTGENILIAGFVIAGDGPVRVLMRAVGPALTPFGVTGAKTAENDNWGGTAELKAAFSSVAAFNFAADNSRDAALVATLAPGSYTAQVTGVGNTTGVALVEVYELP